MASIEPDFTRNLVNFLEFRKTSQKGVRWTPKDYRYAGTDLFHVHMLHGMAVLYYDYDPANSNVIRLLGVTRHFKDQEHLAIIANLRKLGPEDFLEQDIDEILKFLPAQRVQTSERPKLRPPPRTHKKLTDEQRADIMRTYSVLFKDNQGLKIISDLSRGRPEEFMKMARRSLDLPGFDMTRDGDIEAAFGGRNALQAVAHRHMNELRKRAAEQRAAQTRQPRPPRQPHHPQTRTWAGYYGDDSK